MAKEIELQNGMKAIVDDEDFERVSQSNWYVSKSQLTARVHGRVDGKQIQLHHFILGINDQEKSVVFRNKNFLDCQKQNLAVIDKEGILRLTRGHRNTSSKYKGVSWNKRKKKWVAFIQAQGKNQYLGSKDSEDEAAVLYNEAARKYFGEHAFQNVIGEDNSAQDFEMPKSHSIRRASQKYRNESKYRGVCLNGSKWQARVRGEYLGAFNTEWEAARAYNAKAKEIYGDKAILNDIPEKVLQS